MKPTHLSLSPRHLQSLSKPLEPSFDQEIQNIADTVRSDVEKELQRVFKTFDVIEHQPIESVHPEGASYAMRVRTGDDDNSHLHLRTSRRDPFSSWKTDIDELFWGSGPFEDLFARFDPLRTGFGSIQDLADSIKNDVERDLNRTFDTFDVVESHPILTDPEHTSYFMKVRTNDNGHVRVKTIKKTPESGWNTHVEEYYRGRPAIEGEGRHKKKVVEGKKSKGERMETENEGRREQGVQVNRGMSQSGSKAHTSDA